jgi:hypothetical protein
MYTLSLSLPKWSGPLIGLHSKRAFSLDRNYWTSLRVKWLALTAAKIVNV